MDPDADARGLPAAGRQLLGPLRQLGYVVVDVEASAHDWVRRFGVGPWRVVHGVCIDTCVYLGQPIEVELSIASSYSNGVEIELISQRGGPSSMYSDHLAAHGPGVQHACFFPSRYDAALEHLSEAGLELLLHGAIAGTRFAYLHDVVGQVVEIADVAAQGVEARVARAAAAAEWDGSDPVRVL